MEKKTLKTKDRKKIIKGLKAKLKLSERLVQNLYNKINIAEDDRTRALWFIRCYGNYIMKNGTEENKSEFKRMMKSIGGDKAKWL